MKTRFSCHPGSLCFIHSKGFTTIKIIFLKTREKERKEKKRYIGLQGFFPGVSPGKRERLLWCVGAALPLQRDGARLGWAGLLCLLLPTREGSPGLSLGEGAFSLLTFQLTLLFSDISDYSAQLPVISGNASALPPSLVCRDRGSRGLGRGW